MNAEEASKLRQDHCKDTKEVHAIDEENDIRKNKATCTIDIWVNQCSIRVQSKKDKG